MKLQEDCGCGEKHEGKMAKHGAIECAQDAADVADMITPDMDLPEWLEAKITLASDYMNKVKDYLTHNMHGQKDLQFHPSDLKSQLKKAMNERIKKIDNKWVVYPKGKGDRLGTHSTKKAALQQLAAIHLNK